MAVPLLLAGTILRRVEPPLVLVWMALRDAATVSPSCRKAASRLVVILSPVVAMSPAYNRCAPAHNAPFLLCQLETMARANAAASDVRERR